MGRSPSICEIRMAHVVCRSTIIRFVNRDGGMVPRNLPGRNVLHQMHLLRKKEPHFIIFFMTLFKALNFNRRRNTSSSRTLVHKHICQDILPLFQRVTLFYKF